MRIKLILSPQAFLAGDTLVIATVAFVGCGPHGNTLEGLRWLVIFILSLLGGGLAATQMGNGMPGIWRSPWQAICMNRG